VPVLALADESGVSEKGNAYAREKCSGTVYCDRYDSQGQWDIGGLAVLQNSRVMNAAFITPPFEEAMLVLPRTQQIGKRSTDDQSHAR
jgi:hypothetical protein